MPLLLFVAGCATGGSLSLPASPSRAGEGARGASGRVVPAAELAPSAAAFVESVGVNVHNGYGQTPYGEDPQRIANLIARLGIHHLRDGTYPGQTKVCTLDRQYAASGVYFDFIVSPSETDEQLSAWNSCTAPAAQSYEGYNEYDQSGNPNWVPVLQAAQQQVYGFANGLDLLTVGPSLTSESDYGALGPVPAGAGNMHDYFAGFNPETPGWGGKDKFGVYGSLAYNIAVAEQTTGQAPMWSTETGYGDAPGTHGYVPAVTKMHYELRTLLYQFNAGVRRTYLYELVDEGGGNFGSFGLVDAKTVPKPVFYALAALLRHLSVKKSAPASLDYALSAGTSVEHTLLALGDGRFALALWQGVPEWNPNTDQPIAVYPQPVSLTFPAAPHRLSVTTFDATGKPVTQTMTPQNSVSLYVDGGVSLVDIGR